MKYKVKGKGSKENKSAKTSHCVLESAQKISADTHSKTITVIWNYEFHSEIVWIIKQDLFCMYFIWSAVDVDNMYDSFIEIGNHDLGD